jgi:flagellar basal-body rod protein FlgB
MNDISDATVLSALRRQMTIAAARQAVAAGNLANINTPGYKAQDADFSETLNDKLGASSVLKTTNSRHMQGAIAPSSATKEAEGLAARLDGNTVQIDRELLTMNQAAGEFARAQTALAAKFRLVRYAISETK